MCGITGIVNKSQQAVDSHLLERMTDLIRHRGPDDSGYHYHRNIAFGHRRLSILDLSKQGRQPMSFQNRYWITYNGEIYNYIEIRSRLEKLGYVFHTATDTEVILISYHHWGVDCLKLFNGMWAFAIYDSQEQKIFLARDRFGIKPLYYTQTEKYFAFGSEIKQLLSLHSSIRANREIVIEALLTSIDGHTDDTYFKDVMSFPQSHYGYYDLTTHRLHLERYYELRVNPDFQTLSLDDAALQLRELFEDSVSLRLRSDVKVGTCLSGGLDSSTTSGLASRIYHKNSKDKFVGIHARSTDRETDESQYANIVAHHMGIDLHVVTPSTNDFLSTIDELVETQEEPFVSPSMFMGWHVFQKAKELGCKVMLNGQGGDEILLGYERYFAAFLHTVSFLKFFQEIKQQSENSRLSLKEVLLYNIYFTNPSLRIFRLKRDSILRDEVKNKCDFSVIKNMARNFKKLDELQIDEVVKTQLPHLLRYEDRNSMRHSIETRLPFLDYRLVEFCISIPSEFKIRQGWTKYILRQSIEDVLPASIVWRKNKLGFEAPEKTWLGQASEQMKCEILNSNILKEIVATAKLRKFLNNVSAKELWKYFMLAVWERNYSVSW